MKRYTPLITLLPFLFLCHCALGPMITSKSGKTLGKGNFEIDASVIPSFGAAAGYGVSENFDAGVILEQQFGTVGALWGKYSFLNNQEGWAIALYGGAHAGSGMATSTGAFLGPIFSYRGEVVEPYLSTRYTYVKWNAGELNNDQREDSFIELIRWEDISFSYLQVDLGFNFWTSKKFAININGKIFVFLDNDIKSTTSVVPGLSFIFLL